MQRCDKLSPLTKYNLAAKTAQFYLEWDDPVMAAYWSSLAELELADLEKEMM